MYDRDPNALQGEYLSHEDRERLHRALQKAGQHGVTPYVAARISRMPLFNWLQERQIRSAIRVVDAENDLMNVLYAHQVNVARLRELPEELTTQREIRRLDAQIAIKERQMRLEQLNKAHANLRGESDPDRKYEEQYRAAQRRAEHDIRMKVFNAQKNLQMINELYKERDRMIREVGGSGPLTPEQELQVENIRDFFQRLIDDIGP